MKIKEIRTMNKGDLKTKSEELRKELMKIKSQIATGTTPKSPGKVKQIKKTLAKILIVEKQKMEEEKKDE